MTVTGQCLRLQRFRVLNDSCGLIVLTKRCRSTSVRSERTVLHRAGVDDDIVVQVAVGDARFGVA